MKIAKTSKESIFTGLNNLIVMTITDAYFSNSFGLLIILHHFFLNFRNGLMKWRIPVLCVIFYFTTNAEKSNRKYNSLLSIKNYEFLQVPWQ